MKAHKHYHNDSDQLLLLRVLNNEPEAFGEIFDRYQQAIYRFIYFKVNNQEVAQDLTSQVFLKVLEVTKRDASPKIKSLRAYLYQVARNSTVDYYRSREKEELPLIYNDEDVIKQVPQLIDDQSTIYSKVELEHLLQKLPSDIKEIIVLRYIEGLSVKEVSKITNKKPSAIRVAVHRAMAYLKKFQDTDSKI